MTLEASIGKVKRDISDLVNRVAYGGERVILTSRGKPKAVLVSVADYEQLISQRKARFAVVGEMRQAAPDLPEVTVEQEVEAAIKRVRKNNAAHRD